MADASHTALARALHPITSRVRTDVTAIKLADGSRWTDEPLTEVALARHLNGGPARGVCPIREGQSVTLVALLDYDSHGGETSWSEMVEVVGRHMDLLALEGYRAIPFRSSGGRGIHLYILWDEPQDAYSVRQAMFDVLALDGFSHGTKGVVARQVEVFPKQDEVGPGEYGNQFILPLAGKSVPLDPLFNLAPMERDGITQVVWETSDPVPVRERPVVDRTALDADADPISRVRAALFAIPNDGGPTSPDYDQWRDLAFSVHEATGGSDEGRALFAEWSEQNPKFDAKFFEQRVWAYIKPAEKRTSGITRGTLYAQAIGWGWSDGGKIDTEGFEDVPEQQIREARALAVQEGTEALGKRRVALERLREQAESADDTIYLKAKVGPEARKILLDFPELKGEVVALLKARSKDLGAPLDAKELQRLLSGPHVPTVKTERPLTEFGNAERMLDKFGDGLMYVPELDAWYLWTGVYWRKASDVEIEHCAKETVRGLVNEVEDMASDKLAEFFEFCRQSQRAIMVRNMVSLAASDPRVMVPSRELDKHSHLLGVKNGVVNLKTGELMPSDPSLRITITAGAAYNPKAKCPLFQQTILDVFNGDRDMAEYLLTAFGYALCGKPVEDKLFIAFGDGSNGKSTVFNTVRKVFGGYAKSADAVSFIADGKSGGSGGPREDLIRLMGARFVYVNEPDENGELREGTVKSMTGGDAITARGMYAKTSAEIEPTWVVFMPTNHKPIIKGTDHGIWRRLDLLPFERNFDKDPNVVKDPKREEKLEAEKEGVLALLVRYAMRYQAEGLVQPAKVRAARDSYRSNMDLLAEWLEECCDLGDGFEEPVQRLWVSWENWAKNRGLLKYVSSSLQLSRRLDSRFAAKKGGKGLRLRLGIRLKDDFA